MTVLTGAWKISVEISRFFESFQLFMEMLRCN